MHIKTTEPGLPDSVKQNELGTGRKLRLGGGASRVPAQTQKKATETPLRSLVSPIAPRTPLGGQPTGSKTPSSAKSRLSSAGKAASTTPTDGQRSKLSEGRTNETPSASTRSTAAGSTSRVSSTRKSPGSRATAGTPSKLPTTPVSSRVQATAGMPSRRSSLSSSISSSSANSTSSITKKKQNISSSTPTSRKATSTPSTVSRKLDPTMTPVTKKSSIPPRTPKPQNNPTTPSSKPSCSSRPTPRRPAVSATPRGKLSSTPQARSKSFFPTTPVSRHTSINPATPIPGDNCFSTPTTTLNPLTPLQPRNTLVTESSRKLHFGINVAKMAEQENMGNTTPRHSGTVITEATFSFDKNRLAQIKSRRNGAQLLKSPAQRIRAPDFRHPSQTPARGGLQQVAEDRSTRFDEGVLVNSLSQSPARRSVANSLF